MGFDRFSLGLLLLTPCARSLGASAPERALPVLRASAAPSAAALTPLNPPLAAALLAPLTDLSPVVPLTRPLGVTAGSDQALITMARGIAHDLTPPIHFARMPISSLTHQFPENHPMRESLNALEGHRSDVQNLLGEIRTINALAVNDPTLSKHPQIVRGLLLGRIRELRERFADFGTLFDGLRSDLSDADVGDDVATLDDSLSESERILGQYSPDPRPERVELPSRIRAILGFAHRKYGQDVILTLDVPADLQAKTDPHWLARILGNLFQNAVKYNTNVPRRIRVVVVPKSNEILVSVVDNGVGIAPDDQDRIFESNYRAPAVRGSFPGTGEGLNVVQALVVRQGGRIWVESALGKGSTFTFSLHRAD